MNQYAFPESSPEKRYRQESRDVPETDPLLINRCTNNIKRQVKINLNYASLVDSLHEALETFSAKPDIR